MAPQNDAKPKRHKKRKSRTEVSSDSSESEHEVSSSQPISEPTKKSSKKSKSKPSPPLSTTPKRMTDAEVEAAFTKFYLQRVTTEFEDDLDALRKADDFKDDALGILIGALQQGTGLFSVEEKRRIVEAGQGKVVIERMRFNSPSYRP